MTMTYVDASDGISVSTNLDILDGGVTLQAPKSPFPNLLSEFVFTRTYSRWLEGESRRETWEETVTRYTDFIVSERKIPTQVVKGIHAAILSMDAMPSMRALWSAGESARRDNTMLYNCVGQETQFITEQGVRSFKDFTDGDKVKVLTHTGAWKDAVVHSYGEQRLQNIRLARGRSSYTVRATANHQWVLSDGARTRALQTGMHLHRPPSHVGTWEYEDSDPVARYYWALGFTYGDGTRVKDRAGEYKYSMVRLCGAKMSFLPRFQELGFKTSAPATFGGDAVAYTGHYLKTLPSVEEDGFENVVAFVRGLLDADGHKNANGSAPSPSNSIQVSGAEAITFVRDVFPTVGAYISREVTGKTTNLGVRPATSNFGLVLGFGDSQNSTFSVQSIDDDVVETVWCLEVEDDHSFVLPNGLVTGNCSFTPIDSLRAFTEILYILMMGTGVGYSVERQFTSKLPLVQPRTYQTVPFVIADSTDGWADAFQFGLENWFAGNAVAFDYSLIRPEGAPLKTKGGRASGPDPLKRLFDFCEQTVLAAAGRKIKSIEAHDMACMTGEIVMSGGVRRAALISISDVDDEDMRHAKDWSRGEFPTLRYMANNSSFYAEKPSEEVFWKEWGALVQSKSGERGFSIDSWHKRANRPKGKVRTNPCVTGDTRVMTNRGLVQIVDLVGSPFNVAVDRRFNTTVLTRATTFKGAFKTGTKEVFTLKTSEGYTLRLTGDHQVMTSDGWKEAQHLEVGDLLHLANTEGMFGQRGGADAGMLAGWVTGDGCLLAEDGNSPRLYFYGADHHLVDQMLDATERLTGSRPSVSTYVANDRKHFECAALREHLGQVIEDKFRTPEFVWQGTEECQRSYLSALFSADGSVGGNREKGAYVRLHSSKLDLLRDVQTLLLNFGIACCIYEERRPAGYRDLPDGRGGYKTYLCEADHDLHISKENMIQFHERIGFIHQDKQAKLAFTIESQVAQIGVRGASGRPGRGFFKEPFTARFESLVLDGVEDVFDMTVPEIHSFVANGLVVHNCGEIGLRYLDSEDSITGSGGSGQFCNLSAAIMRSEDTIATFAEKVRLATWMGVIQASFTHFPYLRPGWSKTCEEDRLLGVDVTGQCDAPHLSTDPEAMTYFNRVAIDTAAEASAYLGINMPVAITCGKPSGNSSQLVDCASGFHARYAPYYIRRVRVSSSDPLYMLIRDSGVPVHKDNQFVTWADADCPTWVAEFPVKAPEGAIFRDSETALEMLDRYLNIMNTWCGERGHNQSVTIYVKDHEWEEVGQWVWDHFDEITGLSFLPYSGGNYKLAPYEEIDESTYNEWMTWFPEVDFSLLSAYEREDRGEGAQELACIGGSCTIDYDVEALEAAGLVDKP